jgi:hypothetical protein
MLDKKRLPYGPPAACLASITHLCAMVHAGAASPRCVHAQEGHLSDHGDWKVRHETQQQTARISSS